jgi:hypothetical protein
MTGSALTAAITLAFVSSALGQSPDSPDPRECAHAAERLRAASDREKAWGAYSAAACHVPSLTDEIVAQLGRTDPDMSGRTIWGEPQWAVTAMLDALIQLRQLLDASALTAIADRFPTEATILMLRDASKNRSLLAAVREKPVSHSVWMAASNALAQLRAPGFAAALLRELSFINSVVVLDPGKSPNGSQGAGMLSSTYEHTPPGFPPVALYWLTMERAPDAELVSDGTTPIYSQRAVIDPGVPREIHWPWDARCYRCQANCPECQGERVEYLAELAHMPKNEVYPIVHSQAILEWRSAAQIEAAISRALAEQEAGIRRLVGLLAATGALRNSEFGKTFHIDVRIKDERSDRSAPIEHAPVEFRVQ